MLPEVADHMSEAVVGAGLALAAAIAIAGLTLAVRVGTASEGGNALNVLFVVLMTNVFVLGVSAIILHFPNFHLTPRSLLAFSLAGITGTLVARALTYESVNRIGASRTEPLKSSNPLHATLIAIIVLGESVSAMRFFGIGLIVVGAGIVSWESTRSTGENTVSASPHELLLPLGGALFYGIEPIFAKLGFVEGTPVAVGLLVKTLAALLGYLAYMVWQGSVPNLMKFSQTQRRWYVIAGIFNTIFLILYYLALETAPVSLVLPIVTTSPVLVVIFSRLFLPRLEKLTWLIGAGAGVVAAGAALTTLFG